MPIEGWDAFMSAAQELSGAAGGGGVPVSGSASGGGSSSGGGASGGMTRAQWFSAQPDAYRFSHTPPEADPGTAWAEDNSLITNPGEYWG